MAVFWSGMGKVFLVFGVSDWQAGVLWGFTVHIFLGGWLLAFWERAFLGNKHRK